MEDSAMEPRSLQIINTNSDKTITLNEEALKSVLSRNEIKDKYISVISITGAFRQGKSFLLNFLLRYLRIKYVEKKDVTDWLTPDHGSLQGFPYSPGSKRYTVGIHMWSEIFIAKLPTGEEVAIILLDTQGSFDNQSSMDDCARIFALSTLISSVQIYNVMRTIKQYDLAHLQCFGGYGTLMSSEGSSHPFQNLFFLVRDWAFPYEQPYGKDGGDALLREIFGSDNSEVKDQVDNVKSLFNEVDCFLLPHPGRVVDTSNSYNISLDDIDEDFKKYVQKFVTMLLSPERLTLKTVNGTKVKAEDLVYYLQEYTKALKDSDLPKFETMFQATVEAQHRSAFTKALKFYKGIMDAIVTSNPRRSTEDELNQRHVSNKMKAVNYYKKFKKIDDECMFRKYLVNLKETINEEYKRYRAINEDKESKEKNEKDHFGSRKYQQLMLDLLGDRDHDSFDYYELDHLRDKIGYAMYGPPEEKNGYKKEQKEKIQSLFKRIIEENNLVAKWKDRIIISFIYTCTEPLPDEKEKRAKKYQDYDPESDLTPVPVFVLRKCKKSRYSCRVFIDHTGRVYNTWEEYLSDNKLHKCEMIYPKNGRYQADNEGNVILESRFSPACGVANDVLLGTDIASAVGGVASGGALLAAATIPAVAAAPFVIPVAAVAGAAVGIYSLVRGSITIHDRRTHKENLNFFESSEARGAYINIVAGALGVIGAGANLAVYGLAARGFNIGTEATAAVRTLSVINMGAGGVGVVNTSFDVISKWLMENERFFRSSILFFGNVVYNYGVTSTVEESQVITLKNYQDSLKNNRHRKAFARLVKEMNRLNNVQQGETEVISTVKVIENRDKVFAALIKSNRVLNKNNVKFEVQNGRLKMNGITINMTKFNSMDINEVITFLAPVSNMPKPSTSDIQTMSAHLTKSFDGIKIPIKLMDNLTINLLKIFGTTDSTITEKIISAVSQLVRALIGDRGDYMGVLDRIFPEHVKYFQLFNMVNCFFQKMVNEIEEKYFKWIETQDQEDEPYYFIELLSLDAKKRARKIFSVVTQPYFNGTNLIENGLKELIDYFYTWVAYQVYSFDQRKQRKERRVRHSQTAAPRVNCTVCGGYSYSAK